MSDDDHNVVPFAAAKNRRINPALDADEAKWWEMYRGLTQLMVDSERPDGSVITITLRALIDLLRASGMSVDDAKKMIGSRLRMFS